MVDMSQDSNTNSNHYEWDQFLPGLSIDCVIFGYHDKELKILILEYKKTGLYALPGGFIRRDEEIDNAAKRVLKERTGLDDIYLRQFRTFGNLDRFDPEPMKTILTKNKQNFTENHFLLNRFVSISYYALVNFKKAEPIADALSDSCQWYDVNKLPSLIQDHNDIFNVAHSHLKENIDQNVVGQNLLTNKFTMRELQDLYETILMEKLHRTGFHRKMMLSGRLKRLGKKQSGGAHRSPYLYRFQSKS